MEATETVVLTRDLLHAAATKAGAWTKRRLAVFGVPWPPPAGWMDRLAGTEVAAEKYAEFVAAGKPPPGLFD